MINVFGTSQWQLLLKSLSSKEAHLLGLSLESQWKGTSKEVAVVVWGKEKASQGLREQTNSMGGPQISPTGESISQCALLRVGQWHRWFAYCTDVFGKSAVSPDLLKVWELCVYEDGSLIGGSRHCGQGLGLCSWILVLGYISELLGSSNLSRL